MGDSTCLVHGFSYASAIPNQSKQGNPMHVLGESISFGRFMNEPLSWEKWSSFSNKKYVEEAARFAQPGSVAQKKAFFEAHYKRIAAQKAAAALLEQENAAKVESKAEAEQDFGNISDENQQKTECLNSELVVDEKMEVAKIMEDDEANTAITSVKEASEETGSPQIERPLLKNAVSSEDIPSVTSKKKSGLSSLKSSISRKTWKVPSTPAKPLTGFKKENNVIKSTKKSMVDKKRSSPKSLRELINLVPTKEPDKKPISKASISGLPPISRTPKDCRTPPRTPIVEPTKGVAKYPTSTPRRMKTPIDPSGLGSKTAAPKWHILSTVYSKSVTACRNKLQSPSLSTPFILRTEERAAKRKQKLEEKFNSNEVQNAQLQKTLKEKAGNEIRKLSYTFCFKARPLPDFYKERETSTNQMKKTPATRPQTVVLGRSSSNKKQGTVSMPTAPPPPPPKAFTRNGASKNHHLSKENIAKPRKFSAASLPERITHENKSPNIQP